MQRAATPLVEGLDVVLLEWQKSEATCPADELRDFRSNRAWKQPELFLDGLQRGEELLFWVPQREAERHRCDLTLLRIARHWCH